VTCSGVLRQLLGILQYLHGLAPPVFHRDIKPANLVRRPDGSVALIDFGAARDVRPRTRTAPPSSERPATWRQSNSADRSYRADLYALGATLVHLLSGRAPAEQQGPASHARGPSARRRPGIPPDAAPPARAPRRPSGRASSIGRRRCGFCTAGR
jgi:serine/threonine protein kinase